MINFLLTIISVVVFSSLDAQENQVMEKRAIKHDSTYFALYHLKQNKNNEILPYRLVWAQESTMPSGEKYYSAQGDIKWKSIEDKTFEQYTSQEVFELLRRGYMNFDDEQNAQLLKKYVSNLN